MNVKIILPIIFEFDRLGVCEELFTREFFKQVQGPTERLVLLVQRLTNDVVYIGGHR